MVKTELRLALVFYGGVSLAIYMHGVSREVLKLLKASSLRSDGQGQPGEVSSAGLAPSERAYIRFLDALADHVDVQVVADAIAGASAGGVNGIMLARAIAHDLPLEDHRSLWLENADVTRLSDPDKGMSRLFKASVNPLLKRLLLKQLGEPTLDLETDQKLGHFMQSAWFTPPFSGERYLGWMLDACRAMDKHYKPGKTLVPEGQSLDLFVTLTDYIGHRRKVQIEDPERFEEKDHRRLLQFSVRQRSRGHLQSDLAPENVPDLVFAARATSSFPGAFMPVNVAELDRVLEARGESWPQRERFLRQALQVPPGEEAHRFFVDGSVVMNKPFLPVIETIRKRPASRKVARRVVYVDPVAPRALDEATDQPPGFFKTIFASMAHIPRNEPISDDLERIARKNREGRRIAQMVESIDPIVREEVALILRRGGEVSPSALGDFREEANAAAIKRAGYAHHSYLSFKLHMIGERISKLFAALALQEGVDVSLDRLYAHVADCLPLPDGTSEALKGDGSDRLSLVSFLEGLDVDYRIRRLRFVVRTLNGFYGRSGPDAPDPRKLDEIKGLLFEQIDHLMRRWEIDFFGQETRDMAVRLTTMVAKEPDGARRRDITLGFTMLGQLLGLEDLDHLHDEMFAREFPKLLPEACYREVMTAWIGFAFYDLATLPVVQSNDVSEISETLVTRISPKDAPFLKERGNRLKGSALMSFGAFFNRGWREHDYLCGRIGAAQRLMEVVLSVAEQEGLGETARFRKLANEVLEAIFEEETSELRAEPEVIARLKARVLGA